MTPRRIKAVWQFTCVSRLTQALVCCAIGLVSLFGTGVASAGVNRWTSNGPEGGSILAFVIDPATPTTLYIGTLGSGVLKSLDGGASWDAINVGLGSFSITALAIDPDNPMIVYAGGSIHGVFKSTDGGVNWSVTGLTDIGSAVSALAIDPTMSSTLYASIVGGGVVKSTDGGTSWTAMSSREDCSSV